MKDHPETSGLYRTAGEVDDLLFDDPGTIRINCGGGSILFGTESWIADTYYTNGSGYSNGSAIANTTNDGVYQSERFGNHSYSIPVTNGSYTVRLHFAEIYFSASNSRLFNVAVEGGQASLSSYDVYLQAGGKNIAKIEQFNNITVSDGALNVSLTNVKDNAKISGIEVIPTVPAGNTAPVVSSPISDKSVVQNTASLAVPLSSVFSDNNGFANLTLTVSGNSNTSLVNSATITSGTLNLGFASGQTGTSVIKVKATDAEGLFIEDEFNVAVTSNVTPATLIRINCGGGNITFGSETWISDAYYSNGSGYSNTSPIANTTNDGLYQSERYGTHSYNVPVPAGTYTVKLHFAEIYFTAANARLFNVNIEGGQGSLSNYDVYLQAGGNYTAKVEQFNNIIVSDGTLNISLDKCKRQCKNFSYKVISSAPVQIRHQQSHQHCRPDSCIQHAIAFT